MHRPRRRSARRRVLAALTTAVVLGTAAVLALSVSSGFASSTYLDLTTAGASYTVNGALIAQGVGPAGTGNFDPFLTLSNTPQEAGWNSDSAPSGDAFYGGGRTHVLSAAAIPTQTVGGILYREFGLDGNDQGSDDYMSVDEVKIFASTTAGLKGYVDGTETFSNGSASKIWDLGSGNAILLRTQALSSGSGQSDMTILVPDSVFPAGCAYGSLTCDKYIVMYTHMGGAGMVGVGTGCTTAAPCNYDTTAGFEEWQTRKAPVVSVTKTATPSFVRTYDWTVKKYVSLDNSTWQDASVSLDLFNGQSKTVYWKITPTRDAGTDSGWAVAGSVTVTNPTGGTLIPWKIDATITSLTDVIKRTGLPDAAVTLTCPVTFPYTLAAGSSFTCTYTKSVDSGAVGTNHATALLSTGVAYSGDAAFDFSSATPTLKYATASLDDDLSSSLPAAATSGTDVTYTTSAACGSTRTITNTAVLTATGTPNLVRTDPAEVDLTCHDLGVSKTAVPAFTRTYAWSVKKYVSLDNSTWEDASVSFSQFDGDAKTVYWKVVPTRDAGTDSGWGVTGVITITNDAPIAATGVSVADTIAGGVTATVDCDPVTAGNQTSVDVPASGTATCSYTASLPDATTRLNTATATLAAVDYTGTRSVDFTSVGPTLVNATATLSDTNQGSLGDATSGTAVSYSTSAACGVDRTIHNVATVTYGSSTATDPADAIVDCLQLSVSKTATPLFTRTWTWAVDKSATNSTLELATGETYLQPYSVTYTATKTDSNWQVAGTITVTSPAGAPTRTVNVTDLYAGTAAVVDCNGATVAGSGLPTTMAGGDTLSCAYSVDLASAANGNNVATATLTNVPSGTTDFVSDPAGVTFGAPTTEVDETIAVTDTVPAGSYCTGAGAPVAGCTAAMVGTGPPSGNVTATSSPFTKTFTYTRIIGPYTTAQCGSQNVDNTADLTTNDTATNLSDSVRIVVTIPCPQGCTLTQGYWKTHSAKGPAPFDDAWNSIPTLPYAPGTFGGTHEDTVFFSSAQTWYQVFWTPPKGGNAYYQLAHQYEAAVLNTLNGADPSAVTSALNDALALFANTANTPSAIGRLKGSDPLRAQFSSLAGVLGSYNEGTIGPGHCDEDMTRSDAP